jgi:predicted acylesterase/phospholipase RssA
MIPTKPFHKLALSLSGGGYRAAAFHLGVLSFLSEKNWQGKSLLERVHVLSTVSGGTFTGMKYVTTIKQGGGIADCYKAMYTFMLEEDLVNRALEYLSKDANWKGMKQRTLINAFAQVYFQKFESTTFGLLWREGTPIHLKEICFNATEFNFAIPFRFQKTAESDTARGQDHGYIGNYKVHIPLKVAKELRLADILAASSCFPLGFEPINFPDDFIYETADLLKKQDWLRTKTFDGDKIHYPVGLMDGGIDDNQGIDAVIHAEKRMQTREGKSFNVPETENEKEIDLFIISDVASPYMKSFIRSQENHVPIVGNWSLTSFQFLGWMFTLMSIACLYLTTIALTKGGVLALAIAGMALMFLAITSFAISKVMLFLCRRFKVPEFFCSKLSYFRKLTLNTCYTLVTNRLQSGKLMVSEVFMKQIRRFGYYKLYNDSLWNGRLITNVAYELSEREINKRKKVSQSSSDSLLAPSAAVMQVAQKSRNMDTKLWFHPEELKGETNMLDTLVACGQFTICFNLLKYIDKTLRSGKNKMEYDAYSPVLKKEIDTLYNSLLEDWKKFQEDPYFKVREWNTKCKL